MLIQVNTGYKRRTIALLGSFPCEERERKQLRWFFPCTIAAIFISFHQIVTFGYGQNTEMSNLVLVSGSHITSCLDKSRTHLQQKHQTQLVRKDSLDKKLFSILFSNNSQTKNNVYVLLKKFFIRAPGKCSIRPE